MKRLRFALTFALACSAWCTPAPAFAQSRLGSITAIARQRIVLEFDGPVKEAGFKPGSIMIHPDTRIRSRHFHPEGRRMILATVPLEADASYTLQLASGERIGAFTYTVDQLTYGHRFGWDKQARIDAGKVSDARETDSPFSVHGAVSNPAPGVFAFTGNGHIAKRVDTRMLDGYTVALWVKAEQVDQPGLTGVFHNFSSTSAVPKGFQVGIDQSKDRNYHWIGQSEDLVFGTVSTEWVHLAVCVEEGKIHLYYNGAWRDSLATGYTGRYFMDLVTGVNRGGKRFFRGSVAGLQVYDYPLYAGQVNKLATETRPAK